MRLTIYAHFVLLISLFGTNCDCSQQAPIAGPSTSITVTATRGSSELAGSAHSVVWVGTSDLLLGSSDRTLHSLPGVSLQNTTPGQASPILRGFTGYHTLLMLDGVRLNNAIFRSGPNQYSSFVDSSILDRTEVLLGPAASSYGSDALGGVIHFISKSAEPRSKRFQLNTSAASADLSHAVSPSFGWDSSRFALYVSGSFRRHNDLRAGKGLDSRNIFTRYLGISLSEASSTLGSRLAETAYSQSAFQVKFTIKISASERVTAYYQNGSQYGLRSYRELTGGLGRLQARYEPQSLDLAYLRHEKTSWLGLSRSVSTLSWNRQNDHSTRQGPNYSDPVVRDENSVQSFGLGWQGSKELRANSSLLMGVDGNLDWIRSKRSAGTSQFPDHSSYFSWAPFIHLQSSPFSGRFQINTGLRWNVNRFRMPITGVILGLPRDQHFSSLVGFASASYRITKQWDWIAIFSQGFRAPNVSDLAATGLTGLGFEVPAAIASSKGALLALDANEAALPRQGVKLGALESERLNNFELGFRFRLPRSVFRIQAHNSSLLNPIVRRTVLFPSNAVPTDLNGIAVRPLDPTSLQKAAGVVTVASSFDPRAIKTFANDGQLIYRGGSMHLESALSSNWFFTAGYTLLFASELNPNRPVRRLPPQQGSAKLQWNPSRRFFLQTLLCGTGSQTRLSLGDLDDERIGASRSRRDILNFLRTPIGTSFPIRESSTALLNRLLPLQSIIHGIRVESDTTRIPVYPSLAPWWRWDLTFGITPRPGWQVRIGFENLADANFRTMGSGTDSLGRGVFVQNTFQF